VDGVKGEIETRNAGSKLLKNSRRRSAGVGRTPSADWKATLENRQDALREEYDKLHADEQALARVDEEMKFLSHSHRQRIEPSTP